MNLSVYLFGDLGSGYTQYPDDYTNTIFGTFYKNAQATTQIGIHREGDLMYYGYIRKLEENNYVGLCTVVNGKMITQVDNLFSIFESVIESMVRDGYLIHFNDKGDIISKIGQLYENKEEIYLITSSLQSSFNSLESVSEVLPPVNYSASNDSIKNFSIQDDEAEIINSSYTNDYTFVYKSKGYNTSQMNSYKGIISRKEDEISELRAELSKLKQDYSNKVNNYETIISRKKNENSELQKEYSKLYSKLKNETNTLKNKQKETSSIDDIPGCLKGCLIFVLVFFLLLIFSIASTCQ